MSRKGQRELLTTSIVYFFPFATQQFCRNLEERSLDTVNFGYSGHGYSGHSGIVTTWTWPKVATISEVYYKGRIG